MLKLMLLTQLKNLKCVQLFKKAKVAKSEGAANAAELVNLAYKKIDKAAKTNLIHKNAAARYKSNLAK